MKKSFKLEVDQSTLEQWQNSIESLQLYDYQSSQYLQPSIAIEYILNTIELMTLNKTFNEDSFILALINYAENTKRRPKPFLTQIINTFKHYPNEQELAYFTQIFKNTYSSQMLRFYLKVRKYIFTNYVNPRESYQRAIKFDDWVTVATKFLDNQAIPIIGNRIRDELHQQELNNSIQPIELLIFCYEYYSSKKQQTVIQETIQNEQQQQQVVTQKNKNAQQIAYNMIMSDQPIDKRQKYVEVIKLHEQLAYNYKMLANYIYDTQNLVQQLLNTELTEQLQQELEQSANFKSYSKIDATKELKKTNIYEFL